MERPEDRPGAFAGDQTREPSSAAPSADTTGPTEALPQQRRAPRPRRSTLRVWLAIGLGLLLGVGAGAALGYFLAPRSFPSLPSTQKTVVRPTADVLTQIKALSELTTVSYRMERVIDLREQTTHMFGLVSAEDAILLVASGEVRAGIDLAELGPEDVDADPERGTIRVRLPPPEVQVVRIDNQRTYVHTRRTDLMAKRDVSLESKARREAERTLEGAALEAGILRDAAKNAARALDALLRGLGYAEVRIDLPEER